MAVLKKAVGVLRQADIPFALAGSMACWALGGPPSRHDVDLAIKHPTPSGRSRRWRRPGSRSSIRRRAGWSRRGWMTSWSTSSGRRWVWRSRTRCCRRRDGQRRGMAVPALAPTDVLTSKLLALNEGHLDFEGLLAIVRGVREQVDWLELRRRTEDAAAGPLVPLHGRGARAHPQPKPGRRRRWDGHDEGSSVMSDDIGALTEETRRALAEDPRLGQLDVCITFAGAPGVAHRTRRDPRPPGTGGRRGGRASPRLRDRQRHHDARELAGAVGSRRGTGSY